jgi:uncharacterized protein YutE (UPF0331/DUF86 family)
MGSSAVLLVINSLIDSATRLILFYQSLPTSDPELQTSLEELKVKLNETAEKVKAYTPHDV